MNRQIYLPIAAISTGGADYTGCFPVHRWPAKIGIARHA